MKELYDIITRVWKEYGKIYFQLPMDSQGDWNDLDMVATKMVKSYPEGSRARKLATDLLLAVQSYIVADWEANHGKQIKGDNNG